MLNPILQALSGNQMKPMNNIMGLVSSLKNGNPQDMFNQMMNSNPQFKQFVNNNAGKSPEQIAKENGVDLALLNQLLK